MAAENKNRELEALISLLDEPDANIYEQVCEKIFSYGMDAIPVLEGAWENSFDGLIQERIENIVHNIQLEGLYSELQKWNESGGKDILKGHILVSKFQYPDLNVDQITRQIGNLSQDVWLELNPRLTALEKIKVVNHILYDVNKLTGNKLNINAPDNYYLNVLLDSKKGNPVSLGALFIAITQALGIPVYGVDLPRHFILAYLDDISPKFQEAIPEDRKVLFYINPFNHGALFTRNEIELYIKQLSLPDNQKYYSACDNKTIIKRMIEELILQYKNAGNQVKAEELTYLKKAIE